MEHTHRSADSMTDSEDRDTDDSHSDSASNESTESHDPGEDSDDNSMSEDQNESDDDAFQNMLETLGVQDIQDDWNCLFDRE